MTKERTFCHCEERSDEAISGFSEVSIINNQFKAWMANLVITIDGPAASGKSTVAALLAKRLGGCFLDTGAMYRAVTLAALRVGVDLTNEAQLLNVIDQSKFQFTVRGYQMIVHLDDADITEQLRTQEVTANARYIAAAPKVREKLVQMQRRFAAKEKIVVTEGRDQGTVAFPDAGAKFYLTADAKERARRRLAQMRAAGMSCNFEKVLADIEARDLSDRSRAAGPLKSADDAITVDTTNLTVEQVVEKLLNYIKER